MGVATMNLVWSCSWPTTVRSSSRRSRSADCSAFQTSCTRSHPFGGGLSVMPGRSAVKLGRQTARGVEEGVAVSDQGGSGKQDDETSLSGTSCTSNTPTKHAQSIPAIVLVMERSSCMLPLPCTFLQGYPDALSRSAYTSAMGLPIALAPVGRGGSSLTPTATNNSSAAASMSPAAARARTLAMHSASLMAS